MRNVRQSVPTSREKAAVVRRRAERNLGPAMARHVEVEARPAGLDEELNPVFELVVWTTLPKTSQGVLEYADLVRTLARGEGWDHAAVEIEDAALREGAGAQALEPIQIDPRRVEWSAYPLPGHPSPDEYRAHVLVSCLQNQGLDLQATDAVLLATRIDPPGTVTFGNAFEFCGLRVQLGGDGEHALYAKLEPTTAESAAALGLSLVPGEVACFAFVAAGPNEEKKASPLHAVAKAARALPPLFGGAGVRELPPLTAYQYVDAEANRLYHQDVPVDPADHSTADALALAAALAQVDPALRLEVAARKQGLEAFCRERLPQLQLPENGLLENVVAAGLPPALTVGDAQYLSLSLDSRTQELLVLGLAPLPGSTTLGSKNIPLEEALPVLVGANVDVLALIEQVRRNLQARLPPQA